MKLATVIFPSDEGHEDLEQLLAVLVRSVEMHSPATPLSVIREEGRTRGDAAPGRWLASTDEVLRRLRIWRELVDALPEGEVLGLLDADTAVFGDLSAVEEMAFDVAVTKRALAYPRPLNGGVVFVRGGEAARVFFRTWCDRSESIAATDREAAVLEFGSVDQAALWWLLEEPIEMVTVRVRSLPCAVWNCEESTWHLFDRDVTKILHVKGKLRRVAMGEREPGTLLSAAFEAWAEIRDESFAMA